MALAAAALGVALYAAWAAHRLEARIAGLELAAAPAPAGSAARPPAAPSPLDAPPEAAPVPTPESTLRERAAGGALRRPPPASPLGEDAREAFVRALLAQQVAESFPDERMDEATREQVVEILTRVRALRSVPAEADGASPEELADALRDAELDLIELTGMGVGELLVELEGPERRVLRPHEAHGVDEGELRKRFADELSRRLGVTEPGSVEVYEDGEWRPR